MEYVEFLESALMEATSSGVVVDSDYWIDGVNNMVKSIKKDVSSGKIEIPSGKAVAVAYGDMVKRGHDSKVFINWSIEPASTQPGDSIISTSGKLKVFQIIRK